MSPFGNATMTVAQAKQLFASEEWFDAAVKRGMQVSHGKVSFSEARKAARWAKEEEFRINTSAETIYPRLEDNFRTARGDALAALPFLRREEWESYYESRLKADQDARAEGGALVVAMHRRAAFIGWLYDPSCPLGKVIYANDGTPVFLADGLYPDEVEAQIRRFCPIEKEASCEASN